MPTNAEKAAVWEACHHPGPRPLPGLVGTMRGPDCRIRRVNTQGRWASISFPADE